MAVGPSAYQRNDAEGGMVPVASCGSVNKLPLLPFERELIAALGCTEGEYRDYRQQLVNYGRRRPAAYAHIPDVQAGPVVPILVNLAIGVALTAVGALLAPKPKQAQRVKEGGQLKLGDAQGADRYNATTGFQGVQEIAELGSVVAIPFGRYERHTARCENQPDYVTGGLSIAPQLVWSRMFSYGNHQGFKGLYVVGENLGDRSEIVWGGDHRQVRPNPSSIVLGTMPLDGIPTQQQALYWNINIEDGRIKARDFYHGSRGTPEAGDPEANDDIYLCPLSQTPAGPGFCMAITPSGNTDFGAYSPAVNGTAFKLNWRIVPIPRQPFGKDDPDKRLEMERRKIAGLNADNPDQGMPGLGRGYSAMMGILSVRGYSPEDPTESVSVTVGDELEYVIRGHQLSKGDGKISDESGVSIDDVNNSLNARRANADDQLQVGEVFIIGRTIWQVIRREGGEQGVWRPGGNDVKVIMKMIETTTWDDYSVVGIAGRKALGYSRGYITSEGDIYTRDKGWIGPSFWPVMKIAMGVVRNVRPAETTEIGIRSQVWNRANGLCNFNTIPPPNQLVKYERPKSDKENGITVTSGTMNQYFARTSVFTIWLRPVGVDGDGNAYKWVPIGEQFCVTGSQPVDQFNFIRIRSNAGPRQMEYRFIPKTNADIKFYAPPEAQFWRLNAKSQKLIGADYDTIYGRFRVSCVGDIVTLGDEDPKRTIVYNTEFKTEGRPPSSTIVNRASAIDFAATTPGDAEFARSAVYFWELIGEPNENNEGQRKETTFTVSKGSRSLTIKFSGTCAWSQDVFYRDWAGFYWWEDIRFELVSSSGEWSLGDTIEDVRNVNLSNVFRKRRARYDGYTMDEVGFTFTITDIRQEVINDPGDDIRMFETRSQLCEVSPYEEVEKSCANGPEHAIVYVNETVTPTSVPSYPFTMFGMAVRSSNAIKNIEQLRMWLPDGVRCRRFLTDDYGPSNLFSDLVYYLLTDRVAGLGSVGGDSGQWVEEDDFKTTAKYLNANKMFFDGVIGDQVNLRSYLTQIAPYMLCNFVITSGQFSVTPALPFSPDTGEIEPKRIPIAALFSEGNIIEGSYSLEYLEAAERQNFKAVVVYRVGEREKTPQTDAVLVRWKDINSVSHPQEVFDLSDFCTSREQALMTARYLLSIRRRVDHTIKFQTLPQGLQLSPGQYIKVITSAAPDSAAFVGVVKGDTGQILSATHFDDGQYEVTAFVQGDDRVSVVLMDVKDGVVTNPALHGAVFSSLIPEVRQNVYVVEQLELNEDGLVEISASHFPVGYDNQESIIARDTLDYPFAGQSDLRCSLGSEGNRFIYVQ